MRLSLLLLALLLPQVGWAQFGGFTAGSYVLRNSPMVRHEASLQLNSSTELRWKDAAGNKQKLTPDGVSSFRIGKHRYVTADSFTIKAFMRAIPVERAFVELVDSGWVMLVRYDLPVNTGAGYVGTSGNFVGSTGNHGYLQPFYLLRLPTDKQFTIVNYNMVGNSGKEFKAIVLPFFADRPDLVAIIESKRFSNDELPALVHAYNSSEPYAPLSSR
jgi:hypothetical protein